MRPIAINYTLVAGVASSVLTATAGSVGSLALNGTLVNTASNLVTFDNQRRVRITASNADIVGTIQIFGSGTDSTLTALYPFNESLAGPTALASVDSVRDYKTVTTVNLATAATGAFLVGTGDKGSSPWAIYDWRTTPAVAGYVSLTAAGAIVSVERTMDSPYIATTAPTAFTVTTATTVATPSAWSVTTPAQAVRITVTSATGGASWRGTVVPSGRAGP